MKLVPLAGLLLSSAGATSVAAAQLDLPAKPGKPPEKPAGSHEGLGPVMPPKGDVAPGSERAPLDLPALPSRAPGADPEGTPSAAPGAPPGGPAGDATDTGAETARALFRELERARDLQLAGPTIERLLALGPAVVPIARAELGTARAPVLLAAARLCLMGGESADRAAVAERLTRALPAEVAAPLLDELLARDPMLASPEYLAGLLEHPTPALRMHAVHALEQRLALDTLAVLAPVLASKNAAARAAALELVARVPDALAWNLLASRLGDSSARLAQRASSLLASTDEAEALLLERAFPAERAPGPFEWDRARAYALLALVEREEARASVLLDERRVATLLGGLASSQPLIAGACAAALARIGFRSSAARAGAWLDRDVPHQLVRAGTGAEFHADFSSLERPALRALALISGEGFAQDGEAWRRWWLEHAGSFHARHAVIELGPGASGELAVEFEDEDGRACTLLGPTRVAPADRRDAGASGRRVLRLDPATAERLLGQLEGAGVFGIERLPDPVRARGGSASLRVAVGEQEKSFADGPARAPWLAELRAELVRLQHENAWQAYFDPAATSAAEWWQSQHERLARLPPMERELEQKRLLIEALRRARGPARDELVADLRWLYARPGVPEAADFEPLLAVLASEPAFAPRGETLCELARVAAGGQGAESTEREARERLISLGLERFGPESDGSLARVARDLEPAALRALALDPRPRARALACAGLSRSGAELELGRALLADREPAVRLAVLAALAETPVDGLRAELLSLARAPDAPAAGRGGAPDSGERLAALCALVRIGGKDVHDLALEAVGDPDPSVQAAGVAALAELADPSSASLLASLLARGPDSPLYAEARRGLQRLGAVGTEECLRLARSAGARARREAALVLSQALAPEAAGFLVPMLDESSRDERVLWELSVLAGQDFLAEPEPAVAVTSWWDLVVHDDPCAWLCAAAERAGVAAPPPAELAGVGSPAGARFLLALTVLDSPALVERAARELERVLALEFERPGSPDERAHFRAALADAVRARFGE